MENDQGYLESFFSLIDTRPYLLVAMLIIVIATILCFSLTQLTKQALQRRFEKKKIGKPWWSNLALRGITVAIGLGVGLLIDFSITPVLPNLPQEAAGRSWMFSGLLGATVGASCTTLVWIGKWAARKYLGVEIPKGQDG